MLHSVGWFTTASHSPCLMDPTSLISLLDMIPLCLKCPSIQGPCHGTFQLLCWTILRVKRMKYSNSSSLTGRRSFVQFIHCISGTPPSNHKDDFDDTNVLDKEQNTHCNDSFHGELPVISAAASIPSLKAFLTKPLDNNEFNGDVYMASDEEGASDLDMDCSNEDNSFADPWVRL